MRNVPVLVGVLLVSAVLGGCSRDAGNRTAGSASPTAAASASPSPPTLPVRLIGDGIDLPDQVATFGEEYDQVAPALVSALGEPTLDTGEQESFGTYGTCPGTRLRALEFGEGALYVLFGDAIGPGMTMYQWSLTGNGRPEAVPKASALVGDASTFEFGVGDTVADLRAGTAGSELEVRPGDEVVPPSFRLDDQSAGFFGRLTGPGEDDRIESVLAGEPCGE